MNEQLTKVAAALDGVEVVGNLVRSKEGLLIARANYAGFETADQANAAARLFKVSPKLLEVARLVLSAAQNRSDRDYQLMHIDLSEAAEIARAAIAAAEARQAEPVNERVIDRTWARFCGAFGDGPDAPYPGMIEAFETHYGQSFRDKDWRTEAACWAAAWHKAVLVANPQAKPARLTDEQIKSFLDGAVRLPPGWKSFAKDVETAVLRANGFKVDGSEPSLPVLTPEQIEKADAAIREALGDASDCMRVWEAWSCGTMGPDDFWLVAESDERVAEIRNAAAAALGFKVDNQ